MLVKSKAKMTWLLQQMAFYIMFAFAGFSVGHRLFSNAVECKPFSAITGHFISELL